MANYANDVENLRIQNSDLITQSDLWKKQVEELRNELARLKDRYSSLQQDTSKTINVLKERIRADGRIIENFEYDLNEHKKQLSDEKYTRYLTFSLAKISSFQNCGATSRKSPLSVII